MKNSNKTQHHRSETKKKEEQKMEGIAGCRVQAGSREQGNSSHWNSSRRMQNSEFRYGIAKILQGLRKFRNHSENFAILVKFSFGHIFAMITKIRYHSESYCA